MSGRDNFYFILATLYVMIVILSNIAGGKLAISPFGGGLVPTSLFLYPFTFFISDLVAEIYGLKRARYLIYLGFISAVILQVLALCLIAIPLHPQGDRSYQNSLETLFSFNRLSLASSLLAFTVSQWIDVKIYLWLKNKTQNRLIWLRTNLSTILSQSLDSLLINFILFYGFLGWNLADTLQIFAASWMLKVAFSILSTPLFYLCIGASKSYALDH